MILNEIITDFPGVKRIILWSDSCVPQNKNSIMSMALMTFLQEHPNITSVEQKYSEPGHGNIQEVDAVHSKIERTLELAEVFSSVSLLRNLYLLAHRGKKKNEIYSDEEPRFLGLPKGCCKSKFYAGLLY